MRTCNFTKKTLWHKCFPVNFVKHLRNPILQNTWKQLLLKFKTNWKFLKILSEIQVPETFSYKVAGWRTFQHRCFPINFRKLLRTHILQNTYKQLCLKFQVNYYFFKIHSIFLYTLEKFLRLIFFQNTSVLLFLAST